ncbi:MAG: Serine/threonine-protein kinase PknD [Anaerolineales bacterium]|nr:Serine/threonine-protein kinase PknD [Anaerolineales bacterium]
MSDWIGKTAGKVRIEKLLGRGGMAEVYAGTHVTLDRPVAVKFLHGYLEEHTELFERFQREARVVAGLRHPNIIQVYDYDVVEERPYIVMELINGPSLAAYLKSLHERGARMPLGMLRRLLPMLASALDYAHQQGVVHRDIKPGNILLFSKSSPPRLGEALPPDVEPLLADFGLVRVLSSASQTSSGLITGTPNYMSPEQARGEHADHRSDVYSLGILLYEMISGRVPFDGETVTAVMHRVLYESPPPIQEISPALQAVLDRALQKEPDQRYQSAGELSNAFLGALGALTLAETLPPISIPASKPVTPPATQRNITLTLPQPNLARWGIVAVIIVITAATLLLLPGWLKSDSLTGITPTMEHGTPGETPSIGALRFQDVAGRLDGVTVFINEMPPPAEGTHYEVWLVGGEIRRSLGILELDAQGNDDLAFVDDQSRNLLARYDSMEITVEPSPDPSPNASGAVVFSSAMPPMALAHVRHVLVSMTDTPGQIGLIEGLRADSLLLDEQANLMLDAFDANDRAAAQKHAEAITNLIVGSQSPDYGDLDGDGEVTDPGDGYGLLLNGENPGYTEGVESHTLYAMQGGDASESVILHGGHVVASITNVEGWLVQLRDLSLAILKKPSDTELRGLIVQAVGLADQIVTGVDLDGDERIEPILGEGGVTTAYQHAYYMADMDILFGAGQVMPPGPTPSATMQPYEYQEK